MGTTARSMTFQINDRSAGGTVPAVWVTLTENEDGTITFNLWQEGGVVGDLRGFFFDIADESLIGSLSVSGNPTEVQQGNDSVKDLGDGANMNGLLGSTAATPKVAGAEGNGFDVGVEIGSAGICKGDDIRAYSFTLDSSARDLTLADFSNVDFGVRLTSVGSGFRRSDSAKLLETSGTAANAVDDSVRVHENDKVYRDNVLSNDTGAGQKQLAVGGTSVPQTSVTWTGNNENQMISTAGGEIEVVKLLENGSYVVDASALDFLSEGEELTYHFTYEIKVWRDATSWSTDTATLTVTVVGVNDGPQAVADATGCVNENTTVTSTGSVIANDTDVDRNDTLSFVSWAAGTGTQTITNGAGATVTLGADGTWAVDASAADALSQGEHLTQTFAYTMTDNHGAQSTAMLTVEVCGVNDGPDAKDDDAGCIGEAGSIVNGDVAANDSDVDRTDTHTYELVEGSFTGLGVLTFNKDGTWTYTTDGKYADLTDGQEAELSFQYRMTDNHGASDVATVTFCVSGEDDQVNDPRVVHDDFPTMSQEISNVVLYLDDGDSATALIKVKLEPGEDLALKDVDDLFIDEFLATHGQAYGKNAAGENVLIGDNPTLVGISIHAGNEYPQDYDNTGTAHGEGAFYFLEQEDVTPVGEKGKGWSYDWEVDSVPLSSEALSAGFSPELLLIQAPSYTFDGSWIAS